MFENRDVKRRKNKPNTGSMKKEIINKKEIYSFLSAQTVPT